ncbi:MAG: helix-turn-helix transcriptional regulator [Betaproteobacteria bacterium]|nr:MAG: helix-turn-helix transcriptional regulator [Betaproteobacteria bacterium]
METKSALVALGALAQETRLGVFRVLVEAGPTGLSVGEIAASVKSSPATLSFHLKELSHAGLVVARQEGRYIYYAANYGQMNELLGFLTENCCARDCGPDARACNTNECAPTVRRDRAKATPGRAARPSKRCASRGTVKT